MQFIEVKHGRGPTQLQLRGVKIQWTELQQSLFREYPNTSNLPSLSMLTERFSSMTDLEHSDGLVGILGGWKAQFNLINEKVNNGNLASALISIATLLRAMEAWESKSRCQPR